MKKTLKLGGIAIIVSFVLILNFGELNQTFKSSSIEIEVAGGDLPIYIGMSIPKGQLSVLRLYYQMNTSN